MSVTIKRVTTKKELKTFSFLHKKHYKNDSFFISELDHEIKFMFNKKKNPFYKEADVEFFLAYNDNVPVGRICAHVIHTHNKIWNENIGWFGFWITPNDEDIAFALLDTVFNCLKKKGVDAVRGPGNFCYYHEWGLLIHGFAQPNRMMLPYNAYYYKDLLGRYTAPNKKKYHKKIDLLNFYYDITHSETPPRLKRINKRIHEKNQIRIRSLNMKQFEEDVQNIFKINNIVYNNNFGTLPVPDSILNLIKDQLKFILDPEMILFAENNKGETVGLQIVLPDVNCMIRDLKGSLLFPPWNIIKFLWRAKIRRPKWCRLWAFGVLEEYRKKGIDALFYEEAIKKAQTRGYKHCDIGWVLDCNYNIIKAVESVGGKYYKRFRIYECLINKNAKTQKPVYSSFLPEFKNTP